MKHDGNSPFSFDHASSSKAYQYNTNCANCGVCWDYAAKYPGRFIPFVAGQRGELGRRAHDVWESPTVVGDIYLQEAEEKLKTGHYFGLGEFILYHHAYDLSSWGQRGGEVRLPVDSYLMSRIAELGAKYGVPVLFHAEAEPDIVPQVETVLRANPRTSFIWAHNCGRGRASQTSALLERYPQSDVRSRGHGGDPKR